MKSIWMLVGCLLAGMALSAPAQLNDPDTRRILSRLQSMSHGYYPASEWNEVLEDIGGVVEAAEAAGNREKMVEVTTILGEVYSGMLGQHQRGLAVLNDLKRDVDGKPVKNMSRLYVKLAEVQGRLGNEAAITSLIEEFKRSPYYDPDQYTVSGLDAADVPVLLQRPNQQGDSSITVSAMEKFRRAARVAPGKTFPSFSGMDLNGMPVRLPMPSASVVLVDFWLPGWTAWERDLAQQKRTYEAYRAKGFEIIGFPVTPSADAAARVAAEKGLTWPQVVQARELAALCGLAGDAANFLIDAGGTILARDIHGGELTAAVRAALGE